MTSTLVEPAWLWIHEIEKSLRAVSSAQASVLMRSAELTTLQWHFSFSFLFIYGGHYRWHSKHLSELTIYLSKSKKHTCQIENIICPNRPINIFTDEIIWPPLGNTRNICDHVIDLMGRCPEGIIWFLEFWLVVSPVGPDYWWTSDNKLIEID